MSENQRSHMEKNKSNPKRNNAGPSTGLCDIFSPGKQTPPTLRQNQSIRSGHPAIYRNTRSHKLLRRAIRIWKIPVPILNATGMKQKPISFQKRVEMLRDRPGDAGSPKPISQSVRDLQLRSSGSESSPSPSNGSSRPGLKRAVQAHRSHRFRQQLQWCSLLSHHRRRRRDELSRPEGQASPAGISGVKGSEDEEDSDPSPVIRVPSRKTNRRLWRRQLDSSSSENSPTNETRNGSRRRADAPRTAGLQRNSRSSFSGVLSQDRASNCSWTEIEFLDKISNVTKEASLYSEKNISNQDSSNVKPVLKTNEKSAPQASSHTSLEVKAEHMEEDNSEPEKQKDSSLVSQATAEFSHCSGGTQQTSPLSELRTGAVSCRCSQWRSDALDPTPLRCDRVLSSSRATVSAADSSTE